MSKELFPEYVRVYHEQRAHQALRAAERERLAKIARSNPHGVRHFVFTRLIALLRKFNALRRSVKPAHPPTVRHRRVG